MAKRKPTRTEQRRQESLNRYIDALFNKNSRLDAIRIDLYYKQDNDSKVSLEEFDQDINHLYANRRSNAIFKNIVGYVIKMESTNNNNYHAHAMFFTNGQNQREYADTKIAMDIGYYWTNVVTKGKGYYNNCNMNTYKHNGIGRILYNDKTRIKNLKENVAPYFCKGEQNITTPDGKCIRALRRGLMPRKTNKGRPRKYNKNIN